MGFQLPRLETEIDCAPLGYPGLIAVYWLNPVYKEPQEDGPAPWDRAWYRSLGEMLIRLEVPGSMTDSGKPETIEVGGAKALWDLEHTPGFDYQIVTWSASRLASERAKRMEDSVKN